MRELAGPPMRLGVGIATSGRAAILTETLAEIMRQTRVPDVIIVCPARADDIEMAAVNRLGIPLSVVTAAPGLPRQRNAILAAARDCDVLVFFDDDFFPEKQYLAAAQLLMQRNRDIVLATGDLIADGINGPGVDPAEARMLLDTCSRPAANSTPRPEYNAYGCNMVLRLAPVRDNGLKFDEALPLYGWQEDVDFSRQLARYGRVVRSAVLTGVHLGTKRGRTSGVKFGYSQIANPIYLIRKGTMSGSRAVRLMARNVIMNFARVTRPEAWVDRAGRCRGNLLALADLSRGRLHPGRVLDID